MNYRNLAVVTGLTITAGVLVWQLTAINQPPPRSLNSKLEEAVADARQPTGEVSIEVNYLAGKSDENEIVFEVSLNTHSVDLDDIDFQKTVILEKDGRTLSPQVVEISGSSHHRTAVVKFVRAEVPFKIVFLGTPEVGRQEFEFRELK